MVEGDNFSDVLVVSWLEILYPENNVSVKRKRIIINLVPIKEATKLNTLLLTYIFNKAPLSMV